MKTILDDAVGKLKHRKEKERKQRLESQRQLAMKRSLNQKQVKKEGGRTQSYMDLMKTRVIKVEPDKILHVHGACNAGKQHVLEQDTDQDEPRIKTEPNVRIEPNIKIEKD